MEKATLWSELQERLCIDYAQAFTDRDVAALSQIYQPHSVVRFHQLSQGKSSTQQTFQTIAIYTGSLLGALLRLKLPASLAARVMFRRLGRQGYHHSEIRLLAIEDVSEAGLLRARANCSFERYRNDGEAYEKGYGLYSLVKIGGAWRIAEAWIYDAIDAAPSQLGLDRLSALSCQS